MGFLIFFAVTECSLQAKIVITKFLYIATSKINFYNDTCKNNTLQILEILVKEQILTLLYKLMLFS